MLITQVLWLLKIPLKYVLFLYHFASTYFIFETYGNLFILQILLQILLLWSHISAIKTEPGPIKMKDSPFILMQERNYDDLPLITKNSQQLDNLCKLCKSWKPPKTHHCKKCNKCIHYRDHHCQWLDCCVGYKNLKFFCQFLVYLSILTITHGLTLLSKTITIVYDYLPVLQHSDWTLIYKLLHTNTLLFWIHIEIVLVGSAVTFQLLYDKFSHIPDLNTYNEEQMKRYVYFRSVNEKLVSLLGSNLLLWFLPIQNKISLNYLELTYPKVTEGEHLLDYHLKPSDENYEFYKLYEVE